MGNPSPTSGVVDGPDFVEPAAHEAPYMPQSPASMPVYAPPAHLSPYQYSPPYPFASGPAYYQPPVYMQPGMQWPGQFYAGYAQPPVWNQGADGKRLLSSHGAHSHQPPFHVAPHMPYPVMRQHQPTDHHATHSPGQTYSLHQQQHMAYGARQPYAYDQGHVGSTNKSTPSHSKRPPGRRRSANGKNGPDVGNTMMEMAAADGSFKKRLPTRSPGNKNRDDEIAEVTRALNSAASQAVASADEVTLALLLTSWTSALEDAQKQGSSMSGYQTAFDASYALEVVSESIIFMPISPDSAVQKALISLFGFVLYGDERMHREVANEARSFADVLAKGSNNASEALDVDLLVLNLESQFQCDTSAKPWNMMPSLSLKQVAIYKVLQVLRSIASSISAYTGILPENNVNVNRNSMGDSVCQTHLTPAGPDPRKAVERSMNEWRKSCARLQGEIAIIVILEEALAALEDGLSKFEGCTAELCNFLGAVSAIVKTGLEADIKQRGEALCETWWAAVATGDATAVFDAVDTRAQVWLALFQDLLSELEGEMNTMGLGLSQSARALPVGVSSLLSASARVAALVSTHRQALDWCQKTSELLTVMSVAFQSLSVMREGSHRPPVTLINSFFSGVSRASDAIAEVHKRSFDLVCSKVLGSLQKSATTGVTVPRQKGIRFEEPEKSGTVRFAAKEGGDDKSDNQRRRKPRHARMKSSPDELLHLNAHMEAPRDIDFSNSGDIDANGHADDESPNKSSNASSESENISLPCSLMSETSGSTVESAATALTNSVGEELPVVYEGKILEQEASDEDDDDRHIVVHEDVVEENVSPKKAKSHSRSMSVDGIPF